MPTPGKNYPGQRGFPTPNSTPDTTARRIFVVPADAEWLGLVMGAVEVLREEWRWYEWGALTPAEAAAAFNTIIIDAFTNVCPPVRPGGGRLIRLNPDTGAVEEGADDGTWQPPTGDYAIPAIPPRETDPACLAAANAANALQLLYEQLSDYWNAELSADEAATDFLLFVAALLAAPFGLIGEAIVAIAALVFRVSYELLEFITADLWTEDFTSNLVCILLACATDVGGVVTFDYECFNSKLAAQTNIFDLTASQLRLFGQIQWMLNTLGGVDALNAAGATTAITSYDCTGCEPETETCHEYNPMVVDVDYTNDILPVDYLVGTYDSGTFADGKSLELTNVRVEWTALVGTGVITDGGTRVTVWSDDVYPSGHTFTVTDLGTSPVVDVDTTGSGQVTRIEVQIYDKWSGGGAYSLWPLLRFNYEPVTAPFGWSRGDNCTP